MQPPSDFSFSKCVMKAGMIWDEVGVGAVLMVLLARPVIGAVVYAVWWREGLRTRCPQLSAIATGTR